MINVTQMDDHRPHVVVPGLNGDFHIIPHRMLEDIADGTLKIADCDGVDSWPPTIIKEWLDG